MAAAGRVAVSGVCARSVPGVGASRCARFVAGERLLLLGVLPSDALPLLVALLGAADGAPPVADARAREDSAPASSAIDLHGARDAGGSDARDPPWLL